MSLEERLSLLDRQLARAVMSKDNSLFKFLTKELNKLQLELCDKELKENEIS